MTNHSPHSLMTNLAKSCWQWMLLLLCFATSSQVLAGEPSYMGTTLYQNQTVLNVYLSEPESTRSVNDQFSVYQNDKPISGRWEAVDDTNLNFVFTNVSLDQKYELYYLKDDKDNEQKQTVAVGKEEPSVRTLGMGPWAPISGDNAIGIETMNADAVVVEYLEVQQPAALLSRMYAGSNADMWDLRSNKRYFKSVYTQRYAVGGEVNQYARHRLAIPEQLKNGWYLAVITVAGQFGGGQSQAIAHVLRSDLAIHLRSGMATSEQHGWVYSHQTKAMIKGGTLSVWDRKGKRFDSPINDDGFFEFNNDLKYDEIVMVTDKSGNQTLLAMREVPLDLSDQKVHGRIYRDLEAFAFSNRNLLMPGDNLPLHALLRDADGKRAKDQRLTLEVKGPTGDKYLTTTLTPDSNGLYYHNIQFNRDAKLGQWTASLYADINHAPLTTYNFQIQEFEPERMDMTLTPTAMQLEQMQTQKVALSGRYLFGAPANGNTVKSSVGFNENLMPFQKHPQLGENSQGGLNWYVGHQSSLEERYQRLDDITLDKEGQGSLSIRYAGKKAHTSVINASLDTSLLEAGGASINRSITYQLWPHATMPAIQPQQKSVSEGSMPAFALANINPEGQFVAGKVRVTFLEDISGYYWTYSDESGWEVFRQEGYRPLDVKTMSLGANADTLYHAPVQWGDYLLRVEDLDSGAVTEYRFYAGWHASDSQIPLKPLNLDLKLEKPSYQGAQKTNVEINVPFDGLLLVTIEADRVLMQKQMPVKAGKNTIPLSVKDWQRHDLYVTAMLLGQSSTAQPRRAFGITPLILDRQDRKLDVTINAPARAKPNRALPLTIDVAGLDRNEKAWVVLSMVDRGIQNMSRYQIPNPYSFLFNQRQYGFDLRDYYGRQYEATPDPFAQPRSGGDAMLASMRNERDRAERKNHCTHGRAS